MQGNDKVIEQLNKILSNELRAINQYFLHSRMLSDWGLDKFAQYEYTESMDEMKHADVLIQRILFLEGLPNMQYLGNVYIAIMIDDRNDVKKFNFPNKGREFIRKASVYEALQLLHNKLKK